MRSQACGRLIDPAPLTLEELTSANESTHASRAYFKSLLDLRRAGPGYDLTSLLVAVEEVGDSLSDEELTANIMLLFGAGHETTSNLIGNGLLALHHNLAQLALMQKGDINWPDVIEELLRYDSTVQLASRMSAEPVQFGDVETPADEQIVGLFCSANRDPTVYDRPDALGLTRSGVRAMSFGGGIHICLGARLARLEGETAFKTLMHRIPNLELPQKDTPSWRKTFT